MNIPTLGERALLLRILGAGVILLLLLWSLLVPPARAEAIPASDLMLRADTPELRFRWTAPPEAVLESLLFAAMRAEAERELAKEQAAASRDASQAAKAKFPFRPYLWSQRWSAEAETPTLLALSVEASGYTGGAHGNLGYGARLFDRARQRPIFFADLFTDPTAAFAALTPAWCAALDAERAIRRGDQVNSMFADCPPLAERTLVPVGEGSIHSFRVLVEPYVAGPWSEGSYIVTLDPAPALPFLKPDYRATFAKP